MILIYKEARKVLIINKNLETIEFNVTTLEISIRIAMSSWWTRLWTLQKGTFAKELQFQLREEAISRQSLLSQSHKSDVDADTQHWSIVKAIFEEVLRSISAVSCLTKDIDADQSRYLLQFVN